MEGSFREDLTIDTAFFCLIKLYMKDYYSEPNQA